MATAVAVARLRNLTVAPRKVRLVADLIRGKKVAEARGILNYTFKRSALPLRKLLDSAAANAEHKASEDGLRIDTEEMVITKVLVDEGMIEREVAIDPDLDAADSQNREIRLKGVAASG